MSNIILPKTDIMLSSCKQVAKICQPLRKLGIVGFSYTRVYDDGTFIDVSDSANVIEGFYYDFSEIYQHYSPDISPEMLRGEYTLCSAGNGDNEALNFLRDNFNIDNILVLVKRKKNYFEVYNFAPNKDNGGIINFYLNNLNVLQTYTYYFLDNAKDIIHQYETDKVIRPNKSLQTITEDKKEGSKDFDINRFYFNNMDDKAYLTKREVEFLNWCAKGKSMEEIAMILNVSKRTAESHINNIKNKLGCYKQSDLIRKAYQLRLCELE